MASSTDADSAPPPAATRAETAARVERGVEDSDPRRRSTIVSTTSR